MRNTTLVTVMTLFVLAALAVPAVALEAGDKAPDFQLKDQFDKEWSLDKLKGELAVLIAATPKSGEAMSPWVDNLKKKYGDKIKVVGMMDLHTLPGIIRGIAKSRIKKETQQPLMLDFNGSTSKAYQANDKDPMVVVIDREAKILTVAKSYTEEAFSSTTEQIDKQLNSGDKQ